MGKTYKKGDKMSRLFGTKNVTDKEVKRKKEKNENKREQALQKRSIEEIEN